MLQKWSIFLCFDFKIVEKIIGVRFMHVNFNGSSSPSVVKLPQLKPVEGETTPVATAGKSKSGYSPLELWKDTLKVKADVDSYSGGFLKGIKNSLLAGAALIGIDWLVTSGVNHAKGKECATIGKILKTPFDLVGKTVKAGWKFLFGGNGTKSIFTRSLGETLKKIAKSPVKLYKEVLNAKNVSKVGKYGLPIVVAGVAAYTTFRSYMNANEKKADIDHRYGGKVGHH